MAGAAGCAEYGYCASHSRYFWGLRLHLLCTLHGLPIGFPLAAAKADERQVLLSILQDTELAAMLPGQTLIGHKNYHGRDFEAVCRVVCSHCLCDAANADDDGELLTTGRSVALRR